ncbi:putative ribokinase [Candida albicans SC5314]|uniref:Ribokinase n=1 Tax=Candida albicans (strain SC5314 / ATCC MYA-2876) TaxID=237561 RepID=A0A1D8PFI3_CANAL|nr:putative ribokinase [Candida albicans SC5314]AOW26893.1 putative ribokinase [Candida albicans SC5314]|eukprot:XP_711562.2 putative ribokinase [Candida albicans SC5314]
MSSSNPSITIIGSLNYDLVTYTNKVPQGGETYQANSFETHVGGKGLNESIAVAKLTPKNSVLLSSTTTTTTTSGDGDGAIRMVGKIGDDSFGQQLKQFLIDNKVNVDHVHTVNNQTSGVAVILVEEETGENRILITSGANGELKLDDKEYESIFPKTTGSITTTKEGEGGYLSFVILQNEYPDTVKSINWIKSNRPQLNIAYNPSPFKSELITKELLSKIDLLIVNEGEALDVANHLLKNSHQQDLIDKINQINKSNVTNSTGDNHTVLVEVFSKLAIELQKLINPDNIQIIVITMGSKGSIYIAKNSGGGGGGGGSQTTPQFIKSRKVEKVIDTTGAGDTFFGAIVSNLALGKSIDYAIKFATTASSLTIQKKGAAEGIPSYEEVMEIL